MLKSWSKLEKILLFESIILVSTIGIIFKSDVLTTVCSIVRNNDSLITSKGKKFRTSIWNCNKILYSIVSFNNKFYGEVIIYLFMMFPMYIIGIVSWLRHKNKETDSVEVNKISKKEWIIVAIVFVAIFVGIYYLLKAFNTNELVVSTISVLASLFAIYLQIRRSRFNFSFYMINDIILMVLWGIPVLSGNFVLLPMVCNPIINFINDSYGFYNWKKLEKEQRGEL